MRLLVGPWTHGSIKPELSFAGDVEFGHDAALDSFRQVHLDWFDRHVKNDGESPRDDQTPPVRIFVMGGGSGERTTAGRLMHGGRWRTEQEWPLARTRYTPYFLHADGTLSLTPPGDGESSTTYRFDPANPVPSNGGNISSLAELGPLPPGIGDPAFAPRDSRMSQILEPGGFDQVEREGLFGCQPPYLPLGSRPDVLVFQTDPFEDDLEVTGPIEVILWVKSSAVDTDFTAKLLDVYPPSRWYPRGYALNLSDSIMRLRYRRGPEREQFLSPDEIDQVTITLYPTSNLFARGHRLRLDISSSNYPRFDVNPNTGEPLGRDRRKAAADNTVFHDATRCSQIVLPVIP